MADSNALEEVSSRFADTVFCDDVRMEDSGKMLIVGMYSETMEVLRGPVLLPGLTLIVQGKTPVSSPFEKFRVRIFLDDQIVSDADLDPKPAENEDDSDAAAPEPNLVQHIKAVIKLVPFPVTRSGTLRVRVETESEILRAGSLRVVVHEMASPN